MGFMKTTPELVLEGVSLFLGKPRKWALYSDRSCWADDTNGGPLVRVHRSEVYFLVKRDPEAKAVYKRVMSRKRRMPDAS